ncbi:dTDP-4-dehydrorhamnose reductase [Bosea caraganae]|uniref:dTDP-4-dehydrorhamnose reductase n=1 Tax=Bosea caraganae TaxID=2763117 RepID=A0A370L6S4_9HYPH|nr:dTDP-4-dehydrorhamnose reductase [Bosea caraganae]RDJ25414.1 dTDP-4-dehydrorhamnose reductase [Bosea caraganae]RDJ25801.1 dTDP-4-dehydrorhamnose reductase [Bosea caraganae]
MKIVVTGTNGQVVTALRARAAAIPGIALVAIGRPELDLADARAASAAIRALAPDIVVNAAAYTAVDQAESEPELAMAVNGAGAGAVAAAARAAGAAIIQISTDYVFDGTKTAPYLEDDPVGPISAYGRSKLAGEETVAAANPDHVILRTAWVYAAHGKNFLRTMLRLAETRDELSVVADQQGCPSYAPDIADIVLGVAQRLRDKPQEAAMRGVFHLAGAGETSWAGFAEEIFAQAAGRGLPHARVRPITTADYPTPASRPANSRLSGDKLKQVYGLAMPDWRDALGRCMDEIIKETKATRT